MKTVIPNNDPNLVALVVSHDREDPDAANTHELPIIAWEIDGVDVAPICANGMPWTDDDSALMVFDREKQVGYDDNEPIHGREKCVESMQRWKAYGQRKAKGGAK